MSTQNPGKRTQTEGKVGVDVDVAARPLPPLPPGGHIQTLPTSIDCELNFVCRVNGQPIPPGNFSVQVHVYLYSYSADRTPLPHP